MKNWISKVKYYLNSFLEVGVLLLAVSVIAEVIFGPNAYKVNNINYSTSNQYKKIFLQEANKLINQKIDQLDIDYSGIRPKIKFNGQMNDFIIKEEPKVENFYNLIGIDSPGLTSSLAIAKYLQSIIQNN